ncbi:hypothetical protein [Pseudactinotalea sp.]|uniref:hypothetical protein n=1 Tax=Pseudactinotalea sp. TaxID=1926260 RepID=UPI003B3A4923
MTERFRIDLTGPESHVLVRRPGERAISIGPHEQCDLVVGNEQQVQWDALDEPSLVAAGWPSTLRYEGADPEVARWAARRGIENLQVTASRKLDLDLTETSLQYLTLRAAGHPLSATLPSATTLDYIALAGDPAEITVRLHPDGSVPGVILEPTRTGGRERRLAPSEGSAGARSLPMPPALRDTATVLVYGDPFDVPFDARSLLSYPHLSRVELRGAVAHLDALARLPLHSLELRYVPDLTGLPPLSTWPHLAQVIVWNSDAAATKRVRSEVRRMPPGEGLRSASQGRDAAWFATEHGLPFSAWPKQSASAATRAFREAAKEITAAASPEEAQAAIEHLVRAANALPEIFTSEREDLGEAVWLLAQLTEHLDPAAAMARFDAVRDF